MSVTCQATMSLAATRVVKARPKAAPLSTKRSVWLPVRRSAATGSAPESGISGEGWAGLQLKTCGGITTPPEVEVLVVVALPLVVVPVTPVPIVPAPLLAPDDVPPVVWEPLVAAVD